MATNFFADLVDGCHWAQVARGGGAENASTGKRKYETAHFARIENASTENASTLQTFSQIKKFGTSQVSVVHFQVGWESGLQIVFSEIT